MEVGNRSLGFLNIQSEVECLRKNDLFDITENFLEKFHFVLQRIEEANKVKDIPDVSRLYGLLSGVISSKKPDFNDLTLTKKFIELISQHKSCLSEQFAIALKNMLSDATSGLNDYFFDEKLMGEGIIKILEVKLKDQSPGIELIKGDKGKFRKVIEELVKSADDREIVMILEHTRFNTFPFVFHITPVFFRKIGNKLEILVTDSNGGFYEDLIKDKKLDQINLSIYMLSRARQHSSKGYSPIFTLMDIIHYFKHKDSGSDLFAYAHNHAKPYAFSSREGFFSFFPEFQKKLLPLTSKKSLKLYSFDILPAKMMKMMQSQDEIEKFFQDYPEAKYESASFKKEITLLESYSQSARGDKKWNYYADFKLARCVALLGLQRLSSYQDKCI